MCAYAHNCYYSYSAYSQLEWALTHKQFCERALFHLPIHKHHELVSCQHLHLLLTKLYTVQSVSIAVHMAEAHWKPTHTCYKYMHIVRRLDWIGRIEKSQSTNKFAVLHLVLHLHSIVKVADSTA